MPVYNLKLVLVENHIWLEYAILFPMKYKILQIMTSLLTKPVPECLNYNIMDTFKDDKWWIECRINIRCEPFSKYGSMISNLPESQAAESQVTHHSAAWNAYCHPISGPLLVVICNGIPIADNQIFELTVSKFNQSPPISSTKLRNRCPKAPAI